VTRLLAGVLALLAAGAAGAHPPTGWHRCNGTSAALCGYVTAPLDPTGRRPGNVRLYAQFLASSPADGKRGTLFLFAGGPGQPSAEVFDLAGTGRILRNVFPGYDLVAFDDRGTGRSGALSCPGLAEIATAAPDESARLIGRCGIHLGPRRVFYSTAADAADADAVRRALGVDRIAI
jgi:pimeloyl-ACP methyl ester carboxylesterase